MSGDITRCAKGSAALKVLIGMGAGSTYFDAIVKFKDVQSDSQLGETVVDKNRWGLGGVVAASQDIEHFMDEAAKKIASELTKAKKNQTASLPE